MIQLFRIAGFLPYVVMVFMNAFVDLGHKIIIQNTLFKTYDGDVQIVLTALVNALILLPFVLLFTPAGFLADRFPKDKVMRLSAWGAVLLTLAITAFYYLQWFWAAFAMTPARSRSRRPTGWSRPPSPRPSSPGSSSSRCSSRGAWPSSPSTARAR
ncbi:MAG: hypothetical protein MUC77_08055 [Chromatiaceae bacterium]|nr:hypothetical protein [Chromatiaceae bacterium]